MLHQKKAYFLVFILLFFSGNPLALFLFGKYNVLFGFTLTILILKSNFKPDIFFYSNLKFILFTILIIALLQYVTFSTLALLAFINLVLKILMGGLIFNSIKDNFSYVFFRVIATLSLISIISFVFINIFGLNLPYIQTGVVYKSYLLYGILPYQNIFRNVGMFWEPGAYAGVLTLCLALIFKNINYYWATYKLQFISIVTALITTQSTTGYLIGFLIFLFHFLTSKSLIRLIILSSIMLFISYYTYNNTDFLKNKFENQYSIATFQRIGQYSNSRFGSLIFDWHYISKHPFIGNGFNMKTRYADHQFLFRGVNTDTDVIGSGNGFSGILASMGIFFVLGYFLLLWNTSINSGKLVVFILCFVVFLNLQGEQWLNYPLYLGLPFFRSTKNIEIKFT
jgi:hypothetical protein